MSRNISSIFLTLIFVAFISAPTIISMVDDSFDTSIFYSITEEEEKICHIKVLLNTQSSHEIDFALIKTINNKEYYFKKYSKPHLNLISPPPELHIL
ncbi:hypothetical protein V8G69_06970 [Gaetbulibacter sp. M235]|uniref:hypothetical protein n=1 Tax=Gaetbulibacter sp. M235 TaxID=3126510 RepID=UPI00374E3365